MFQAGRQNLAQHSRKYATNFEYSYAKLKTQVCTN